MPGISKFLFNLGKFMVIVDVLLCIALIGGGIDLKGDYVAIMGFGLVLAIPFLYMGIPLKLKKDFNKQLKNINIGHLKNELRNSNAIIYKPTIKEFGNIYLLDSFIFQQGFGVANFKDIFWVYIQKTNLPREQMFNVGNNLIIALKNKSKVTFRLGPYNNDGSEIIYRIRHENGNILIGNSLENRKEFKSLDT